MDAVAAELGFTPLDDEAEREHEAAAEARRQAKEARIAAGTDEQIDVPAGEPDAAAVAALSPAEREARWGFSHDELAAATKVVRQLYERPHLFVGDPVLAETRLYVMVSRDRKAKRGNKEAIKRVQTANKTTRQRQLKEQDREAVRKTTMRLEREAALQQLLLPPPEDDDESGASGETPGAITAGPSSASASPAPVAAEGGPLGAVAPAATAAAEELTVHRRHKCHTCKNPYTELHHYYYALCRPCGDLNFVKRQQSRDLTGKTVLLTGARIKIGYAMSLSLLRAGAQLVATSRFIHDAQQRFAMEPDYEEWAGRLHLFAIDLRDLWMVHQFCAFLRRRFGKLYAIVNNAAQTIARPPEYTAALRAGESDPQPAAHSALMGRDDTVEWMSFMLSHSSLPVGMPMTIENTHTAAPTAIKQVADTPDSATPRHADPAAEPAAEPVAPCETSRALAAQFPAPVYDRYDTAAEAADTRETNSWTANLGDVEGGEAAEVMAINGLAPLVLNSRLKPMLLDREGDAPDEPRFVINVSAMEGQFYRFKQTTHPHTNMAKAALNMMTRTSGADFAKDNIFMNAVDTGWITDESPHSKKQRRAEQHDPCPLDEVDAAARCLDLIYMESREHSKFWKDYHEIPW